jgi:hypothetical protein
MSAVLAYEDISPFPVQQNQQVTDKIYECVVKTKELGFKF